MVTIIFMIGFIFLYLIALFVFLPPILSAHTAYFYNRHQKWNRYNGFRGRLYTHIYQWCEILRMKRFE